VGSEKAKAEIRGATKWADKVGDKVNEPRFQVRSAECGMGIGADKVGDKVGRQSEFPPRPSPQGEGGSNGRPASVMHHFGAAAAARRLGGIGAKNL
jgi:hypothetical protein